MKKSKRYIKKQNNKPLINKKVLAKVIRESNICKHAIKEPNGSIHYNGAFTKRATSRYSFATKEWTDNKNPICWHGGLFECKDNILTGRYFSICLLQ